MHRSFLHRAALGVVTAAVASVLYGAPPAHAAATFVVNSNADDDDSICQSTPGDCTLREALAAANATPGLDTIEFDLPPGQTTIAVSSQLPLISDQVVLDGTTQPGYVDNRPVVELDGSATGTSAVGVWLAGGSAFSQVQGLSISRFSQEMLIDSTGNDIRDNNLGTDLAGTETVNSPTFGTLRLRTNADGTSIVNNVIGSGSGAPAVMLEDVSDTFVNGNFIGVGRTGSSLGSVSGSAGIRVTGASQSGNLFQANRIDANGALGIDLGGDGVTPNDPGDADAGVNGLQNYPVLSSATGSATGTTVTGTLNSTPSSDFSLEFFASPSCDPSGYGEGGERLRPDVTPTVTTDASGNAPFSFTFAASPVTPGQVVTAIASTVPGTGVSSSSEFSQCVTVAPPAPRGVTAAAGDGEAEVAWLPVTPAGGGTVDSYSIRSVPDTISTPITASGGDTEILVPALDNGTEYTFTVTAFRNGEESSPSDPSDPVTPRADAPPPEATTATLDPGGQLTTGSDATVTDPTNTTVVSPNGGTVSIGEGVTEQPAPDGGPYYGQQVDITAPDATATDPLELTFVVDCSVLPAEVSTCPNPIRAEARSAPRATVSVHDGSYAPRQATVDLGGRVTWRFVGKRRLSITESVGLRARRKPLFDSGARPRGATFAQSFRTAGTYAYRSAVRGDPRRMAGTVGVPVDLDLTAAGATVTWATALPAGTAADVQYRFRAAAGDDWSAWTTWQDDVDTTSAELGADAAGEGDYQLRSRLVNARTARTSGWSPRTIATVADGAPHVEAIDLWHQTDLGVPTTNTVVPDCTGPEGTASPAPTCVWSEEVLPDGDLRIRVFSTINGRWRAG